MQNTCRLEQTQVYTNNLNHLSLKVFLNFRISKPCTEKAEAVLTYLDCPRIWLYIFKVHSFLEDANAILVKLIP
jgi:hypothetical protein